LVDGGLNYADLGERDKLDKLDDVSLASEADTEHLEFESASSLWKNKAVAKIFASMYEVFNPLTTVAKQRVVEWFSGSSLDTNRWTKKDSVSAGTFAMVDATDEGFSIIGSATAADIHAIDFNNIRHYSQIASVTIAVWRRVSTTDSAIRCGFVDLFANDSNVAYCQDFSGTTFKILRTGDATATTNTNTTVAIDTVFHVYKTECRSADVQLSIDGVLEATNTTTLPTKNMQPTFLNIAVATGINKEGRIKKLEAFNT